MSVSTYILENRGDLELYTKAISKVHGESHPEVKEVRELYRQIVEKLQDDDADVAPEFEQLRAITNNFEIPGDACETYEATYKMLAEADRRRS